MRKWYTMKKDEDGEEDKTCAEIVIYDFIGEDWFGEGVSAKTFQEDLKALGAVDEITLRVNSPGGIVTDGIAIFNLLDQHPARVIAMIDGIAASAASLIVMAADEIVMPANAFMLIHEPRGFAMGTSDDMISLAADLERMTDVFAAAYAKRSGKVDTEAVKALMKEDRLMTAEEALDKGFADRSIEAVKMAASFDMSRLPVALRGKIAPAMQAADPVDEPSVEGDPAKSDGSEPDNSPAADPPGANVVNLDAARAEGRASAAEIAELCALAGLPQMTAEMIRAGKSAKDARASLLEARAKADEKVALQPQRAPLVNTTSATAWGKALSGINARFTRA